MFSGTPEIAEVPVTEFGEELQSPTLTTMPFDTTTFLGHSEKVQEKGITQGIEDYIFVRNSSYHAYSDVLTKANTELAFQENLSTGRLRGTDKYPTDFVSFIPESNTQPAERKRNYKIVTTMSTSYRDDNNSEIMNATNGTFTHIKQLYLHGIESLAYFQESLGRLSKLSI